MNEVKPKRKPKYSYGIQKWIRDEDGVAAVEFTLVFPIMFIMMLAIWDLGNGILANQKSIAASQMVADLIAREVTVDNALLSEIYDAAEIAMMPLPIENNFVVEVLSVGFDPDTGDPIVRFHRTSDGSATDQSLVDAIALLSVPGDGAVAVQVRYTYRPYFSDVVTGDINMRERAYSRGRRSGIVNAAS